MYLNNNDDDDGDDNDDINDDDIGDDVFFGWSVHTRFENTHLVRLCRMC